MLLLLLPLPALSRSRSRSGVGEEAETDTELLDAYPDKLSRPSGVATAVSPAAFLNICKSDIFPLSLPAVEGVEGSEGSASVPAERGRRADEKDGRPEDLVVGRAGW